MSRGVKASFARMGVWEVSQDLLALARVVAVAFCTNAAAEGVRFVTALTRGGRSCAAVARRAHHAAELAGVGAALLLAHLVELNPRLLLLAVGEAGRGVRGAAILFGAVDDRLGLGVVVLGGAGCKAGVVGAAALRALAPFLARLEKSKG